MRVHDRRTALLLGTVLAALVAAVPVLGQELSPSPSASAEPSVTAEPSASAPPSDAATASPTTAPSAALPSAAPAATPAESQKPPKSPSPDKADREPEVPVALTGRIGTRTDTDGELLYTLRVGSTTYTLETGPRWFWGDAHPLAALVGQTMLVRGEGVAGGTTIDVFTAGGTTIRGAGKPPWAGGWKVVGERHPGWSQAKADRWAAKLAKWAAKWPDGKPGKGPFRAETPLPLPPDER